MLIWNKKGIFAQPKMCFVQVKNVCDVYSVKNLVISSCVVHAYYIFRTVHTLLLYS